MTHSDPGTIDPLKQSLAGEEKMAKWLENNVEMITKEYMAHDERDAA